jgi:hypothetical protein
MLEPNKQRDHWLRFLTRAKKHANAEEGVMATVFGGAALALWALLPAIILVPIGIPIALGMSLLAGASVKAIKRRHRLALAERRKAVPPAKALPAAPTTRSEGTASPAGPDRI